MLHICVLREVALNANMSNKSSPPLRPIVAYPTLIGRILAQKREAQGIKQGDLANRLGLSQSAYSRLEAGDSILNVAQLRNIANQLGLTPSQVIELADKYETQLRGQGVEVISQKPDNTAAIAVGLGLLTALLLSGK
jgi:transcriptional regulator with XRE-family HTH domain